MPRLSRRLVAGAVALMVVVPAVATAAGPSPNAPKSPKVKTQLFTYPKRNLGCIYVAAKPDFIVCATRRGIGVMLSGRTPRAVKRNLGKPRGKRPVIRYGKSRKLGRFTCTSTRAGITCKARNGAGFRINGRRPVVFRRGR